MSLATTFEAHKARCFKCQTGFNCRTAANWRDRAAAGAAFNTRRCRTCKTYNHTGSLCPMKRRGNAAKRLRASPLPPAERPQPTIPPALSALEVVNADELLARLEPIRIASLAEPNGVNSLMIACYFQGGLDMDVANQRKMDVRGHLIQVHDSGVTIGNVTLTDEELGRVVRFVEGRL